MRRNAKIYAKIRHGTDYKSALAGLFIKTILLLVSLTPFVANAKGVNCVKDEQIVFLLKKHGPYIDPNPIWQEDADEVNAIFFRVIDGFKKYTKQEKHDLRVEAFLLLYDNSLSIFEDAVDNKRMAIRRSLCFMTLAMLSDRYRYGTFIKDAMNSISTISVDSQPKRIVLIKLLEILLMNNLEDATDIEKKIKSLYEFFKANKDYFNTDFVSDFSILMQKLPAGAGL